MPAQLKQAFIGITSDTTKLSYMHMFCTCIDLQYIILNIRNVIDNVRESTARRRTVNVTLPLQRIKVSTVGNTLADTFYEIHLPKSVNRRPSAIMLPTHF